MRIISVSMGLLGYALVALDRKKLMMEYPKILTSLFVLSTVRMVISAVMVGSK